MLPLGGQRAPGRRPQDSRRLVAAQRDAAKPHKVSVGAVHLRSRGPPVCSKPGPEPGVVPGTPARPRPICGGCAVALALLAAQPVQLARQPGRAHRSRQQSGRGADRECDQHDEDERRLPAPPVVELERHQVRVLQRQEQQRQKERAADDPAQNLHYLSLMCGLRTTSASGCMPPSAARNRSRTGPSGLGFAPLAHAPLKSTRSRSSLPALKCGTCFSGTCTLSPDFGLRPVRGGR